MNEEVLMSEAEKICNRIINVMEPLPNKFDIKDQVIIYLHALSVATTGIIAQLYVDFGIKLDDYQQLTEMVCDCLKESLKITLAKNFGKCQ